MLVAETALSILACCAGAAWAAPAGPPGSTGPSGSPPACPPGPPGPHAPPSLAGAHPGPAAHPPPPDQIPPRSACSPPRPSPPPSPPARRPVVTFMPSTSGPTVTVTGISRPAIQQNEFLGIPFAAPPVGSLRFVAPQDVSYNSTIDATAQPPSCLQKLQPDASSPIAGFSTTSFGISEDCLYLNIFQPESAAIGPAKLPVVVWLYGGSFIQGAASNYNAELLLSRSMEKNEPVVFVAVNYRMGIFGFGNGQDIADNNAANLGLKDAIKALEWVQSNIAAWGGDPAKVTLAAQSAGAIMASLLMLNPQQDLFRGAIMESGAPSTNPKLPTADLWNKPYETMANYAGCTDPTTRFQCLKQLDAQDLLNAQNMVLALPQYSGIFIFCPSIDGDLIPESTYELLHQGSIAKLPFITGNNKDEGTIFTPKATIESTISTALHFLQPLPLNATSLAAVLDVYPEIPSQGSPYGTGNETFGMDPAFKQLASIVGDAGFQTTRRDFIRQSNAYGNAKTWTYQFEALNPSKPEYYGSYHQLDLKYVFGNATIENGFTAGDEKLSQDMMDYWLNFANNLDPNDRSPSPLVHWPAYGSNLNMLKLSPSGNQVITDDYRPEMQIFLDQHEAWSLK